MPTDLLALFPLLAGYLFVHITHYWRFRAQTLRGHRLVFETAVAGFMFVPVAHLLVLGGLRAEIVPELVLTAWPDELDPVHATLIVSAVVSPAGAALWNVVEGFFGQQEDGDFDQSRWRRVRRLLEVSRKRALRRAVGRKASELEQLIYLAATKSTEDGSMLAVTLQSRKIYLGWVVKAPSLQRQGDSRRYLSFLPVLSGHRTPEDLEVRYTFAYNLEQRLERLNDRTDQKAEDLLVYIPVTEVESARLLELSDYEALVDELETAD